MGDTNFKLLKEKFYSKGFNFVQIKRDENKALYKKFSSKKVISYEVIKINKHNGYTLGGNYIEPSETYPGATNWGTHGWTFNRLEDAEQKYDKLS